MQKKTCNYSFPPPSATILASLLFYCLCHQRTTHRQSCFTAESLLHAGRLSEWGEFPAPQAWQTSFSWDCLCHATCKYLHLNHEWRSWASPEDVREVTRLLLVLLTKMLFCYSQKCCLLSSIELIWLHLRTCKLETSTGDSEHKVTQSSTRPFRHKASPNFYLFTVLPQFSFYSLSLPSLAFTQVCLSSLASTQFFCPV